MVFRLSSLPPKPRLHIICCVFLNPGAHCRRDVHDWAWSREMLKTFWRHVERCWGYVERCWGHVERCWGYVERCWGHVELFRACWEMLRACWKMLRDVERCWEVLRDVERCWEMLVACWEVSRACWEIIGAWTPPECWCAEWLFEMIYLFPLSLALPKQVCGRQMLVWLQHWLWY